MGHLHVGCSHSGTGSSVLVSRARGATLPHTAHTVTGFQAWSLEEWTVVPQVETPLLAFSTPNSVQGIVGNMQGMGRRAVIGMSATNEGMVRRLMWAVAAERFIGTRCGVRWAHDETWCRVGGTTKKSSGTAMSLFGGTLLV